MSREIGYCEHCRGEIYEGDTVRRVTEDPDALVHAGYGYKCAEEYAVDKVLGEKIELGSDV